MNFERATCRMLDDEHRATLAMLADLERAVHAVPPGARPDAAFGALARVAARQLTGEVDRHFRFEEDALFPRLAAAGDGDLAALLVEDHVAIRATASDALPLLLAAAGGALDAAGFATLKPLALTFVERLVAHVDKETLGLLPALESILDEEADRELALSYAA